MAEQSADRREGGKRRVDPTDAGEFRLFLCLLVTIPHMIKQYIYFI
jgi:hypothetical protein